mgnify:CR=1 FL=1
MAEFKVELPKMGESVAEATITTWLKAVGDAIQEDEPIVEIATDKVDSEVPAPCSGILKKVLFIFILTFINTKPYFNLKLIYYL